jgi:hypothetical protein
MKKLIFISILIISIIIYISYSQIQSASSESNQTDLKVSNETQECIDCHINYTPSIVEDWKQSRHSKMTITSALKQPVVERRISITELGEKNGEIVVGCYECHSLNPGKHKDNFEHFGQQINQIVTPNDCKSCHPQEVEEYSHSKKAYAVDILRKNPVYMQLVNATLTIPEEINGKLVCPEATEHTKNETCFACHGTEVKVDGTKIINSEIGEVEVPNLLNYPNTGVGRINPDSSLGSCTSCHPRHSFSIEIARKPETCGQCHLEPDVPAYNVYKESKHGNIYDSKKQNWNFNAVPWTAGKDFTAPTCAACHNSLIVNLNGDIVAKRTHNFGDRLWKRIFGLIYSHNQPKNGKTYEIKLKNGMPLPVSPDMSEYANDYLINSEEYAARQNEMKQVCKNCHTSGWIDGHFNKIEKTSAEADKMVLATTKLMVEYWNKNKNTSDNLFDDYTEKLWVKQWLYYASSVRYATAMSGPDYSSFKNGWYEMNSNYLKIYENVKKKK